MPDDARIERALTGAERTRRYRARKAAGRFVLQLEINDAFRAALAILGFLKPDELMDRDRVGDVVADYLKHRLDEDMRRTGQYRKSV